MAKVLALDFGIKRTGIAITDEMQIIASGLTTVLTKECIPFLTNLLQKENVDCIVIGEPKQMDYTASESEKTIKPFIIQLQKNFPNIPIERIDERFTSKMAFQTMIDAGLNKGQRKNKALIDKISATIILQTYLDQKDNFRY